MIMLIWSVYLITLKSQNLDNCLFFERLSKRLKCRVVINSNMWNSNPPHLVAEDSQAESK
jgi:hypothetical protein